MVKSESVTAEILLIWTNVAVSYILPWQMSLCGLHLLKMAPWTSGTLCTFICFVMIIPFQYSIFFSFLYLLVRNLIGWFVKIIWETWICAISANIILKEKNVSKKKNSIRWSDCLIIMRFFHEEGIWIIKSITFMFLLLILENGWLICGLPKSNLLQQIAILNSWQNSVNKLRLKLCQAQIKLNLS